MHDTNGSDIIRSISEIVGPKGLLRGDDVSARPNYSWGAGSCPARAIVRPASTEELSRVMALCHAHDQSVVPWGGLTGLVDGITCAPEDIAISLERMPALTMQLMDDLRNSLQTAGYTLRSRTSRAFHGPDTWRNRLNIEHVCNRGHRSEQSDDERQHDMFHDRSQGSLKFRLASEPRDGTDGVKNRHQTHEIKPANCRNWIASSLTPAAHWLRSSCGLRGLSVPERRRIARNAD